MRLVSAKMILDSSVFPASLMFLSLNLKCSRIPSHSQAPFALMPSSSLYSSFPAQFATSPHQLPVEFHPLHLGDQEELVHILLLVFLFSPPYAGPLASERAWMWMFGEKLSRADMATGGHNR